MNTQRWEYLFSLKILKEVVDSFFYFFVVQWIDSSEVIFVSLHDLALLTHADYNKCLTYFIPNTLSIIPLIVFEFVTKKELYAAHKLNGSSYYIEKKDFES